MAVFLAFLLALTVKQDHAPLRTGCAADAPVVAELPAGAALKLSYALMGEATPCYRVTTDIEGKSLQGYLPAAAIEGLDGFDQNRRDAAWLDTPLDTAAVLRAVHINQNLATEASPSSNSGN